MHLYVSKCYYFRSKKVSHGCGNLASDRSAEHNETGAATRLCEPSVSAASSLRNAGVESDSGTFRVNIFSRTDKQKSGTVPENSEHVATLQ